jgi:protein-disulfide isomerase-like protein with CxxC motif
LSRVPLVAICSGLLKQPSAGCSGLSRGYCSYDEGRGITHVNILRTLEAMYGLPKAGAQQPNAAKAGISDDYIITDIFETVQ